VYCCHLRLSHSELAVVWTARLFRDAEAAVSHSPKDHKALTLQVILVQIVGLSHRVTTCFAATLTSLCASYDI
jgi:hypothetical protein